MNAAVDAPVGRASPLSDDEALELQIQTAHRAYLRAVELDDTIAVREYFDVMAALIEQRSPARIEQMERETGLR